MPLIVALGIQAIAAVFFFGETLSELRSGTDRYHSPAEMCVALALVIGIYLTIRELRVVLRRADEQTSALEVVRSAFSRVIARQFDLWKLTPAERVIARLSLEGLDIDEIGKVRGAALGTVRAQFARIYSKSGVSSRAQFASIFLTELVGATPSTPQAFDERQSKAE